MAGSIEETGGQTGTAQTTSHPLVFISHDSRDAILAEAFSKLLKSVSAGMMKSFRSSDKRGVEGIEFGDEWYKVLMDKLCVASDVVCLLTERSLDRPWILYEAGVAKGKMGTPVHGLAIGVPLSRVSTGPFYQFQNCDDSDESIEKLVFQLCRRVNDLEPDKDVVISQIKIFKDSIADAIKSIGSSKKTEKKEIHDEGAIAKMLEEMKLLFREFPMRLDMKLAESGRIRGAEFGRIKRFHPAHIESVCSILSKNHFDPVCILVIASLFREVCPWLYTIGTEYFRYARDGDRQQQKIAINYFR